LGTIEPAYTWNVILYGRGAIIFPFIATRILFTALNDTHMCHGANIQDYYVARAYIVQICYFAVILVSLVNAVRILDPINRIERWWDEILGHHIGYLTLALVARRDSRIDGPMHQMGAIDFPHSIVI
jgi:hypothetical protein